MFLPLWALFQSTTSLPATKPSVKATFSIEARDPTLPDWQKDNKTAEWASGYPKTWGSEVVKYTQPSPNPRTVAGPGAVTPDEKFLIMSNTTNTRITDLQSGETVTDIPRPSDELRVVGAENGGYYLLLANETLEPSWVYSLTQYQLSAAGIPNSSLITHDGTLASFEPRLVTHGGRYVAVDWHPDVYIYSFTDPEYKLTLSNHTDAVLSVDWTSDGKYIATTSYDGTGKLWNGEDGTFLTDFDISDINPSWIVRFSPDNKYLAITLGAWSARIYAMDDLTVAPIVIDGFPLWVRTVEWSPDGKLLALGGDSQIQVYSMDEGKVVQTWQQETTTGVGEVDDVAWFGGGSKLAYRVNAGLEVYDFDTNLKYRWGPNEGDEFILGDNFGRTFILEERGWIGGFDNDHAARFWELPEALV
ncbi:hypothetical protein N0V90_000314 [Kalmusia sp. IMI 367209]|nr:hypothetical protein N0V90_000314 [Kalmusia sp. IMI 367209]